MSDFRRHWVTYYKEVIRELIITGSSNLNVGATTQLKALLTDNSNSTDVTNIATWTSSNTQIGTVNNGLVTGVTSGNINITASYDGLDATKPLKVYNVYKIINQIGRTINIVIAGNPYSIANNGSKTIRSQANTRSFSITTPNNTGYSFRLNDNPVPTSITPGTYTITEISTAVPTITITGVSKVTVGKTINLKAVYNDGHGNETIVTNSSTWSCNDTTKATVSSKGVVSGKAIGNVVITVTYNGITATKNITVIAAESTLRIVAVDKVKLTSDPDVESQVVSVKTFYKSGEDLSEVEVSQDAVLTSSSPGVAHVASPGEAYVQDFTGVVLNSAGQTTITSTYNGLVATHVLTVLPADVRYYNYVITNNTNDIDYQYVDIKFDSTTYRVSSESSTELISTATSAVLEITSTPPTNFAFFVNGTRYTNPVTVSSGEVEITLKAVVRIKLSYVQDSVNPSTNPLQLNIQESYENLPVVQIQKTYTGEGELSVHRFAIIDLTNILSPSVSNYVLGQVRWQAGTIQDFTKITGVTVCVLGVDLDSTSFPIRIMIGQRSGQSINGIQAYPYWFNGDNNSELYIAIAQNPNNWAETIQTFLPKEFQAQIETV